MQEILSSKEAAALLKMSIYQLYKLTNSGKIPCYSPTPKKLYFLKSELEDWVLSSKRATVVDLSKKSNNYFLKNKN